MPEDPNLDSQEWQAVVTALQSVAGCSCTGGSGPGSLRSQLTRALSFVARRERQPKQPLDVRTKALRDYVCESFRAGRPATWRASALEQLGFNQAQIAALGMLSV